MPFKCIIDGREFETEAALHRYVSFSLKIKVHDYYQKNYPRFDKLSGDIIEFKNKDFYFHSLFNSRENLITYIKNNPNDIETIKEVISLRKESKQLKRAPSTVEAQISTLPTPLLIERIGLDYNEFCESLGLKSVFDYKQQLLIDKNIPISLIIDTREQSPLEFRAETISSKLDFGDITCTTNFTNTYWERKSLLDLLGTLSKGFERFKRELARAKEMSAYLIIGVEEPIKSLKTIGETPATSHTKCSPEFIMARIKEILWEFDNCQFVFCKNREEMARLIEFIFCMKNDPKTVDIQFNLDKKTILV